jgi:hypothetical protein
MSYTIERRQGQLIVQGNEYEIYQCSYCRHLVPRQEKETCRMCKQGTMKLLGKVVLRPHALPDYLINQDS